MRLEHWRQHLWDTSSAFDVARHFRLSVHDGWRRCEILESFAGSSDAVDLFVSLRLLRACKAWIRLLDCKISIYIYIL